MNKSFLVVLGIIAGSLSVAFTAKQLLNPDTVSAFANIEPGLTANAEVGSSTQFDGECAVSDAYPAEIMQWCGLITQHANQNGLEPNLVAALILQESGGNSDAYSKSGAVGLMQVMPKDGLAAEFMCPNGPCFANRPSMSELYDPAFNIEYGTRFLAGLVSRYGDIREALKYYGPANVGYYYADIVMAIYNRY